MIVPARVEVVGTRDPLHLTHWHEITCRLFESELCDGKSIFRKGNLWIGTIGTTLRQGGNEIGQKDVRSISDVNWAGKSISECSAAVG